MPNDIVDFNASLVEPTLGAPSPDRILAGTPRGRSWIHFTEADMTGGEWESTPGRWTIAYDKWEFLRILAGSGVLNRADGFSIRLEPGTTAIIRPGFTGTWEVFETMRKHFLVRRRDAR
jgi:uncharacterized cupin superfamily protein